MEAYPGVIGTENNRYLPFLLSTTILMEAVKAGVGRETAHAAIKEHAIATVRDLRDGSVSENDLLDRLAGDERLPLDRQGLAALLEAGRANVGSAHRQVAAFSEAVAEVSARHPDGASYEAGSIL